MIFSIPLKTIVEDLKDEVDSLDWSTLDNATKLGDFYREMSVKQFAKGDYDFDKENELLTALVFEGLDFLANQGQETK